MARYEDLDDTDITILRELQENSHLTAKELARRVNLTTSPVFERQKRLEKEGFIVGYRAIVSPEMVGNTILVLCNVRLKQHTEEMIQQFIDSVQDIEEITECYNTSGDYDFLIKVYAKDMKDYQQFMQHTLGRMPCVGSVHSVFAMEEAKNTHGVTIRERK